MTQAQKVKARREAEGRLRGARAVIHAITALEILRGATETGRVVASVVRVRLRGASRSFGGAGVDTAKWLCVVYK